MDTPARQEPWAELPRGEADVAFDVAGVRVAVVGFPVGGDFLDRHYPGFWRTAAAPAAAGADLVVEARVGDAAGATLVPLPARRDPAVVEVEAEGDAVATRSHWHEGSLDLAAGRGRVTFTDLRASPFRISFENFLRVAFASLLVRRTACLVHAAGLVREGRAHVFVGLSGSGKSTIVELSPHVPALSDDLVALRVRDGALLVERVPFHGAWPSTARLPGTYPVARLVRLVRAPRHELAAVPPVLQVAHLRACMPFLAPTDPRALDVASAVVAARPLEELRFARDAGFWDVLA